jgi:hypothetical protein
MHRKVLEYAAPENGTSKRIRAEGGRLRERGPGLLLLYEVQVVTTNTSSLLDLMFVKHLFYFFTLRTQNFRSTDN